MIVANYCPVCAEMPSENDLFVLEFSPKYNWWVFRHKKVTKRNEVGEITETKGYCGRAVRNLVGVNSIAFGWLSQA